MTLDEAKVVGLLLAMGWALGWLSHIAVDWHNGFYRRKP